MPLLRGAAPSRSPRRGDALLESTCLIHRQRVAAPAMETKSGLCLLWPLHAYLLSACAICICLADISFHVRVLEIAGVIALRWEGRLRGEVGGQTLTSRRLFCGNKNVLVLEIAGVSRLGGQAAWRSGRPDVD